MVLIREKKGLKRPFIWSELNIFDKKVHYKLNWELNFAQRIQILRIKFNL